MRFIQSNMNTLQKDETNTELVKTGVYDVAICDITLLHSITRLNVFNTYRKADT